MGRVKKPDKAVGHRIRAIRRRLGLNQADLGRSLGVTQETVSAWERGAYPNGLFLLEIAGRGDTDVEWILTGKTRWQRQAFPKTVEEVQGDPAGRTEQGYVLCPLLHRHVTSSPPREIDNRDVAEWLWVPPVIGGEGIYLMQVAEDGMAPIFKREDIVAIRAWPDDIAALAGLIVAAWLPEKGLVTRWLSADGDAWILYPEARGHPLFSVSKKAPVRFFRVTCWWGRQKM